MQPWQRATEEILRGKRESAQVAGAALGFGLKGSALMRGINSLLKPGVPSATALQGLGKLNPYIEKYGEIAKKFGYTEDEIVDHMRNKQESGKDKSLFKRLLGDVDVSSLESGAQRELGFLEMISEQLEQKGKDESDPGVKKLKKKIQNILKGKGRYLFEAESEGRTGQIQQPMQQGTQPQQAGPGAGQQALMAILQKIQAQRGL